MRPGTGVRAAITGVCHAQTPPATVGARRVPCRDERIGPCAAGAPDNLRLIARKLVREAAEGDRIDGKLVPGPGGRVGLAKPVGVHCRCTSGGQNKTAGHMKTPNRKRRKRIQVIVPRDELLAVEAFRFQSRMPSRAAAVRELLRRGMASTGSEDWRAKREASWPTRTQGSGGPQWS